MNLTAHRRVELARPLLGLVVALVSLSAPAAAGAVGPYPDLGGCPVFPDPPASLSPRAPSLPSEAAWNQDISKAPVARNSAATIAYIDGQGGDLLHPDFGSPRPYGFPYAVVGARQRRPADPLHRLRRRERPGAVPDPDLGPGRGRRRQRWRPPRAGRSTAAAAPSTSSTGPSPSTAAAPTGTPTRAPAGTCARARCAPDSWTSADAAGLPIFPGLVRYDEAAAGHVDHAIRVTFESTRERLGPPRLALRRRHLQPQRPRDGNAAATAGGLRARPLQRPGAGDRARPQALRDDRRRQRIQLVLQRHQRPPLGRREPRSAEADTRQRLPGRKEQGPPPYLLSAQPAPRTTWWKSARNLDRSSSTAGSAASEPASSTLTSTTSSAA